MVNPGSLGQDATEEDDWKFGRKNMEENMEDGVGFRRPAHVKIVESPNQFYVTNVKRDRPWLKAHRHRRQKRALTTCASLVAFRRGQNEIAKLAFGRTQATLPVPNVIDQATDGYVFLVPPKALNFEESYPDTISFLMEFQMLNSKKRRFLTEGPRRRFRHYAMLEVMETMSPAAALVLVAETKRWYSGKPRTSDQEWATNIRDFFHEFGLFDVLGAVPQTTRASIPSADAMRALKFRVGALADGKTADGLRQELEDLCGGAIGPSRAIYKALTEAMTNTRQHAYPASGAFFPRKPPQKWWAGGSWSPEQHRVHVMIYDQGVGIPATLPRSKLWRPIQKLLTGRDETNDASLINAAMELRRSSTAEPGRGKGFKDMTDWIDATQKGFFRVLSGRGQVTYKAGGKVEKRTLPAPFLGTLVEWEISLNG